MENPKTGFLIQPYKIKIYFLIILSFYIMGMQEFV